MTLLHGQLGTGDRIDELSPVRLRHADFVGGLAEENLDPERKTMELQERILGRTSHSPPFCST
jgi:hypothetical protein